MSVLLSIVFWLAVSWAALALLAFVSRRYFQRDENADAVVFVETDDGWRVAARQYRARAVPSGGRLPVVLCPPLALDGGLFGRGDPSLAQFLSEQGHEVWCLDPRGRGYAARPRLWGGHRRSWTFDHYIDFDLPALAAEVQRRSGAEQMHWVGVGTGTVTMLAALGSNSELAASACSCTTLGGALFLDRWAEAIGPRLLRLLGRLPLRALVRLCGPLLGRFGLWPQPLLFNLDNVEPALLRGALVSHVCTPSRPEILQLAEWIEDNELRATDQGRDLRALTATLRAPLLVVVGPRDPLAPPAAMQQTFDLFDVDDKQVLVAGRSEGMSANYGHLDLVLGRTAHRDLFGRLAAWFERCERMGQGSEIRQDQEPGERASGGQATSERAPGPREAKDDEGYRPAWTPQDDLGLDGDADRH